MNGKHARRMSMINRRLCCLTAVAMLLLSGCAQGGPVNVQDASTSGNIADTPAGPTVTDTGVGGLVTGADRTPVVMASVERAAADSSAPVTPLPASPGMTAATLGAHPGDVGHHRHRSAVRHPNPTGDRDRRAIGHPGLCPRVRIAPV